MTLFLNFVYGFGFLLFLPRLFYVACKTQKYREGWAQKLLGNVPIRINSDRPCIWLHGVSVGEINLLTDLNSRLKSKYPGLDVVISSTTKTGYDLAKKKFAGLAWCDSMAARNTAGNSHASHI